MFGVHFIIVHQADEVAGNGKDDHDEQHGGEIIQAQFLEEHGSGNKGRHNQHGSNGDFDAVRRQGVRRTGAWQIAAANGVNQQTNGHTDGRRAETVVEAAR